MQICSEHKRLLKHKLIQRKLNEVQQPTLFDEFNKEENVEVVSNSLEKYNDLELIDELKRREYMVFKKC